MSESQPNQRVTRPSVWHTDNLGDLLAEGVIDIDDLSGQAVIQEQREEYFRKMRVRQLKWEQTPGFPYCPQPDDDDDEDEEDLDVF